MNNSTAYERLNSLIKSLKPNAEDDHALTALIYACASGLELLKSSLDDVWKQQYLEAMSQDTVDKYCILLDIDTALEYEEKKNKIREKLSQGYNEFCADEFIDYYKGLGEKFGVTVRGFKMTLSGVRKSNISILREITKKLEYYLPPFITVCLSGNHLDFENWDLLGLTFQTFDSLGMNFSMIETIK